MLSLWAIVIPAPWEVPFGAMAAAGFFMSNVNAPMQALVMLRIPRELRTQGVAAFGVFQCIGSPIGLIIAGIALSRYDPHAVVAVVLVLNSIAILTFITSALAERSAADNGSVSRIARMLSSTDSFLKIDGSCER